METILTADNNIELEAYQSKIYIATGDAANAVMYVPQSLTEAEKKQARLNIGAGTSSFSGSYNDLKDKPTIPSLTGYATKDYVDAAVEDIDLTNYYTKEETNKAIADAAIGDIDLTDYYTKEETDAAITNAIPSLADYAKKSEIPDVSLFQTEEQVQALIDASLPPSGEEVSY